MMPRLCRPGGALPVLAELRCLRCRQWRTKFRLCDDRGPSDAVREASDVLTSMTPNESEVHIVWKCLWCGTAMSLHADTLWRLVTSRDRELRGAVPLGLACPQCSRLGTYQSGHSDNNAFPVSAQRWEKSRPEEWDLVGWLKCEEAICELRLPLLASWTISTTLEARKADIAEWHWEDLKCPAGHSISSGWK